MAMGTKLFRGFADVEYAPRGVVARPRPEFHRQPGFPSRKVTSRPDSGTRAG